MASSRDSHRRLALIKRILDDEITDADLQSPLQFPERGIRRQAFENELSSASPRDTRPIFQEKQFVLRESLLTEMLQTNKDEGYRSIYHACVAAFVWVGVKMLLQDYNSSGTVLDLSTWWWAFGGWSTAVKTWMLLQGLSLCVIPMVQYLKGDVSWSRAARVGLCYVLLQCSMYGIAIFSCLHNALAPASGLMVMCECARLSMKAHAYCREKVVHGMSASGLDGDGTAAAAVSGNMDSRSDGGGDGARKGTEDDQKHDNSASRDATGSTNSVLIRRRSPGTGSAPGSAQTSPARPAEGQRTSAAGGGGISASRPPSLSQPLPNALRCFADYIPPKAASLGATLPAIRASQPRITIGGTNEEVGRYIYFLFAPTLVYRDEYPRIPGPGIDYMRAGYQLANVVAVILYTYVIIRGALVPTLSPWVPGRQGGHSVHAAPLKGSGDVSTDGSNGGADGGISGPLNATAGAQIASTNAEKGLFDLVLTVFDMMAPAMLIFLLVFFGILHTWQNMWAELLRFGDRRFYTDWWAAKNWGQYYRKWNMLVGDWIHAYIYTDLQRTGRAGMFGATLGVFGISAAIHELILCCAFRFWMPALLILFAGPGMWFMSVTRAFAPRMANIFMWLALTLGLALLMVMYAGEMYARHGGPEWSMAAVHAPATSATMDAVNRIVDVLVPRTWRAVGHMVLSTLRSLPSKVVPDL